MVSPFATDSGNNFAGYTGQIINPYAVEKEYGTQVIFVVQLDHPELFPHIGATTEARLNTTKGWKAVAGGEKLEYPGNPEKKMGKLSEFGVLLTRLEHGQLENFQEFIAAWGDRSPYEMASWKGLSFLFDEVEWASNVAAKDAGGNSIEKDGKTVFVPGSKSRVMPTAFLGVKGGAVSNGAVKALGVTEVGLSGDDVTTLQTLLDSTESYDTFVSASLGNGTWGVVSAAVPDKDVYAALKAGTSDGTI